MSVNPAISRFLNVAVLGASGGIGQPLSLLLKASNRLRSLGLYDVEKAATPVVGVGADLADIGGRGKIVAGTGQESLNKVLRETGQFVFISAGIARKPGMTRDDLFNVNANVAYGLAKAIREHADKNALIAVITNPVNSIVPIVSETVLSTQRVFGVTTLDLLRASKLLAENSNKDSWSDGQTEFSPYVPVVGGHAGATIVPLFSRTRSSNVKINNYVTSLYGPNVPKNTKNESEESMVNKVVDGGTLVVNAKGGAGSATLSMAYAAFKCYESVLSVSKTSAGVQSNTACYARLASPMKATTPSGNSVALDYVAGRFTFSFGSESSPVDIAYSDPDLQAAHPKETARFALAAEKLIPDIDAGRAFLSKQGK